MPNFPPPKPTRWNDENNHQEPPPETPLALPCYRKIRKWMQPEGAKEKNFQHQYIPQINMMTTYDIDFPPLKNFHEVGASSY